MIYNCLYCTSGATKEDARGIWWCLNCGAKAPKRPRLVEGPEPGRTTGQAIVVGFCIGASVALLASLALFSVLWPLIQK